MFFFSKVDYLKSDESILRAFLMTNYSADVRPVVNVSTVTYVNITLTIIQIMDLVRAIFFKHIGFFLLQTIF